MKSADADEIWPCGHVKYFPLRENVEVAFWLLPKADFVMATSSVTLTGATFPHRGRHFCYPFVLQSRGANQTLLRNGPSGTPVPTVLLRFDKQQEETKQNLICFKLCYNERGTAFAFPGGGRGTACGG